MKQWQKKKAEDLKDQVEGFVEAQKRRVPEDFAEFCPKWLGLRLTDYQVQGAELIINNDSVALRWSRQSGKTHMISAWLLHYALLHPGTQIAIVGPS